MRVAYYSPLPPERSGVADYSELLLPELRRHVDVVLARRGRRRHPRADVALYHVGNDPDAHGWILAALRARPGVVVLHEFVLHHLIAGLTLGRRDVAQYLAAMEREAGLPGRLLGLGVVDGCIPPLWETRPEDFSLAGLVLDASAGLVVHSRYVAERAREAGYDGPIWRIPHPAWPRPAASGAAALDGDPLVVCVGHLNPSKRVPQLLDAFARLREGRPGARLVLAGAVAPRLDLDAQLRRRGLDGDPSLVREGYVDERRLWQLLEAADVVVGLRAPTMGETSGVVLRALSVGRPLVVSDVGWFAELPDEVAVKVPVDEREVDALADALDALAASAEERATRGAAARALAEREHDLARVAELYAAALEEAAGGAAVREAVVGDVAAAAAAAGIEPGSASSAELGERLRETRVLAEDG